MRLATIVENGVHRIAAVVDDRVIDLAALDPSISTDMRAFLEAGPEVWQRAEAIAQSEDAQASARPLDQVRLAAPVPNPSKIVAIGQNYLDHVKEQGATPPDRPIVFAKFPTTVIGPGDAIRWDPGLTQKVDWEVELAVVIGRKARRVSEADAYDYVFGYTIANDVSARDLQFGDGQWVRGKSLDTFCPLGPWIVTRDEIPEPHGLPIRCLVNGEVMQDSSTDQLIFRVPYLISYLSQAFTLLPGDIVLTGTPPGVGAFRKPPRFLGEGDVVTVEIDGIGSMSNPCHPEA